MLIVRERVLVAVSDRECDLVGVDVMERVRVGVIVSEDGTPMVPAKL